MTFRGDHVEELISASLTGDLTDAERAEMDAHIARCEKCRATLAAFTMERRILAALPPADPPRELFARVRSGIESGRFGAPWWRRQGSAVPLLASAAVFSAAILAVVVLGKLNTGPVGLASDSPHATLSSAPTSSTAASTMPSSGPSAPPTFLAPGQLGYFELTGASLKPLKLSFINDATGASIDLGTVSGPPIAAALSPDGNWLAYITQKGETGVNEVWVLGLIDGHVYPLGCSMAGPFTDRLGWWVNAELLFTLTAVDLGPDSGCPSNGGKVGTTQPWLFSTAARGQGPASRLAPDAFGAGVVPGTFEIVESQAGAKPSTTIGCESCDSPPSQVLEGVFLPTFSPDGNRALFWTGTMASRGGQWQFSLGGMPQLSGDFRAAGPASAWVGTPLFTDLTPVRGEAFAYGNFTWGPDSDLVAFWNGAWTGAPQSSDGKYPNQQDVYVGQVSSGLLSSASRLPLTLEPNARIVDVRFAPNGASVAVTIGLASAGIGDPPSAYLQIVPLAGGQPRTIGGGVNPPPWDGPAVYGH